MNTNDLILVKQLVSQRKSEVAPELSDNEYFEIFTAEQALKDHDLSYDEIQGGIIDGGGDGGIDAVYLFVNNFLCVEPIDPEEYKRNTPIELVFVQAKMKPDGFTESGIDKLISSARDLLNLDMHTEQLRQVYNPALLDKISIFQKCHLGLTSKFPNLSIRYFYASLSTQVHPNVERKVSHLKETVESFFSPVDFSFKFLPAGELLKLARRSRASVRNLRFAETPISTGQNAYVCLANLTDYFEFITEDGTLSEHIFEGNVRDYAGNTEVNHKIRDTLSNPSCEDFWWLNNGISILCTHAFVSNKTLIIDNPEIVNGLQTSRELFNVLSEHRNQNDSRSVLVRVIVTEDDESRDRIIRATNSQTSIPSASLRATDKIHRDIEDFLFTRNLFYERRKNFYKNQGKPVRKIVSIGFLAQSVIACALGDPSNARARPSSLIKRDEDYARIFNNSYPLDAYYKSVILTMRVEDALRTGKCAVDRSHWNNIRFYVSMLAAMRLMNSKNPSAAKMANIDLDNIPEETLLCCINDTWNVYRDLGANDQIAKGAVLKRKMMETIWVTANDAQQRATC